MIDRAPRASSRRGALSPPAAGEDAVTFAGPVIEWRGPAPYLFVTVPDDHVGTIREAARFASYGWGCVPVTALIGACRFATSLFPRDGGYLLPLKSAVRRETGLVTGDVAVVSMMIAPRQRGARNGITPA